jgi:hypothetical protein
MSRFKQALFVLALLCSTSSYLLAQDSLVTMQFRGIEGEGYRLRVPEEWRYISGNGPDAPEFHLELSGIAFPATYKDHPLVVTAFLSPFKAESLDEAVQGTLVGYRKNPDRVFPLEKDEAWEHKLASGERAPVLKTRFFRKSKEMHQIRYDMVSYSEATKTAYDLVFSVQFVDPEYGIEKEYDLNAGVLKFFDTFELK